MFIKELEIHNFRNIQESKLSISNRLNVFCGKNGQGKTSFIESIYFLSCSKSFRTSNKKELVQKDFAASQVKGKVDRANNLSSDLEINISNPNSLKLKLNEKEIKLSNGYLGQLLTVCFCPTDLEIIRAEPAARRRFLDKHLSDIYPTYLPLLLRLNKALKSKASILNQDNIDNKLLDPWDYIISETSEKIFSFRKFFLSDLEQHTSSILPLMASSDGQVSFDFVSNCSENNSALNQQEIMKRILENRQKEIITRRALIGSHRDDFSINLSSLSSREYASQGQARTLVLLLKLGVAELIEQKTNQKPVILLDDVDSELDAQRARFLFDVFNEKNRQIFITSTASNRSFFPAETEFFEVSNGAIIS